MLGMDLTNCNRPVEWNPEWPDLTEKARLWRAVENQA